MPAASARRHSPRPRSESCSGRSVARQHAQVLADGAEVLLRQHERRVGAVRHAAPAGRLDQDADADQLLAHAVVEIEAEPLALLLADRDLLQSHEAELLFALAQRAQRFAAGPRRPPVAR